MYLSQKENLLLAVCVALALPVLASGQGIKERKPASMPEAVQALMASSPSLRSPVITRADLSSGTTAVSVHEKFATFLAGEDFKSVLLLENFRPDLPITFTPTLILSHGEISLDSITVPAH